jgi:hypothetical protein
MYAFAVVYDAPKMPAMMRPTKSYTIVGDSAVSA